MRTNRACVRTKTWRWPAKFTSAKSKPEGRNNNSPGRKPWVAVGSSFEPLQGWHRFSLYEEGSIAIVQSESCSQPSPKAGERLGQPGVEPREITSAVPKGTRLDFRLYPALRLRLRAGLNYSAPMALDFRPINSTGKYQIWRSHGDSHLIAPSLPTSLRSSPICPL